MFAALIVLFIVVPAFAAWSPFGFGFISDKSGDSPAFPQAGDSVYGVNLSIFTAIFNEMYGLCVAGFNIQTENSAGIEVSSTFISTKNANDGVLQISGMFNSVENSGDGMQIAGFANDAKDFTGIQIAAVCNVMSGRGVGVQIGAINSAENLSGVQIGAINIVEKNFSGVQIGAFNSTGDLNGVQVGAINSAGTLNGMQIGVINVVKSSDIAMLPILRAAF